MFEGQRLSYIVPGYTGYPTNNPVTSPKRFTTTHSPLTINKEKHISQVHANSNLGYAGYVHSIKSENIYADTFGKTTKNVNTGNYVKGQDVPAR